jgi:hypothetical protein
VSAPAPDEGGGSGNRANVAALIAIVVLGLLGYWAFTSIQKQRELQTCLAEGRRDCLEIASPNVK